MDNVELKQIRVKNKLSQAKFAKILHLPLRTYQDREYKKAPIKNDFALLVKLVDSAINKGSKLPTL